MVWAQALQLRTQAQLIAHASLAVCQLPKQCGSWGEGMEEHTRDRSGLLCNPHNYPLCTLTVHVCTDVFLYVLQNINLILKKWIQVAQ